MDSDMTTLQTETTDGRKTWHKPEVMKIAVTIDTGLGGGSVIDFEGGDLELPSDTRLKQGITELDQPLEVLLSMPNTVQGAQAVPLLAELIKRQQAKIEDLAAEVATLRSRGRV